MLILGSMPGVASLQAHQYYGNARNYLWPILYALYGRGSKPDDNYEAKLKLAADNGIALWDVIASCEREGSLDSDIKRAVPNDIPALLGMYPNIEALVCNGAKSYSEMMKHFGKHSEVTGRKLLRMPSTSPIPTRDYRGLDDRLAVWRALLEI